MIVGVMVVLTWTHCCTCVGAMPVLDRPKADRDEVDRVPVLPARMRYRVGEDKWPAPAEPRLKSVTKPCRMSTRRDGDLCLLRLFQGQRFCSDGRICVNEMIRA